MAHSSSFEENSGITDINITPLVDIMLVLLIVFMLTANLINQSAIEMNLPKASTGTAVPESLLALVFNAQGQLFLNGQAIERVDLQQKIKMLLQQKEDPQVLLAADAHLSHGQVIELIDTLRQWGVYRFAMNVDGSPKDMPSAP